MPFLSFHVSLKQVKCLNYIKPRRVNCLGSIAIALSPICQQHKASDRHTSLKQAKVMYALAQMSSIKPPSPKLPATAMFPASTAPELLIFLIFQIAVQPVQGRNERESTRAFVTGGDTGGEVTSFTVIMFANSSLDGSVV